jgi:bacterioferritin (cytochrome b1)
MSGVWPYLAAILPTILVAVFFYFIVKSILEGDRRERLAQRQYEREQHERAQDARRASGEHDEAPENGSPETPEN